MFSFSCVFARRTESVMICAPACSIAAYTRASEYLPEPRMKRDVNSRPPSLNVSFIFLLSPLLFS